MVYIPRIVAAIRKLFHGSLLVSPETFNFLSDRPFCANMCHLSCEGPSLTWTTVAALHIVAEEIEGLW